ncbi:MAG: 3-phosphoshikimate 1-carboxyvinyltransferase [Oscillospiraceae bacterium]|nr:3-phosphoshikimate 1-carboxyvinyltransferase [Oscillospiraceae bacterium]
MNVTVFPGPIQGTVEIIPSKSVLHRLLIVAALADKETFIRSGPTEAEDVAATAACLEALGASIQQVDGGFSVRPIDRENLPKQAVFPVKESGSTLRFLLPIVCALGVSGQFCMAGRLPERPLAPLDEELTRHGITLTRPEPHLLCTEGSLQPGDYVIPGNISSQYITGLLLALPLLGSDSTLTVEGRIESEDYIHITLDAAAKFGYEPSLTANRYDIQSGTFQSPSTVDAEGDWSNAAFWLSAGAMPDGEIQVTGLSPDSLQGDRAVIQVLERMGANITQTDGTYTVTEGVRKGIEIDATAIPDLIPVLSAVAAVGTGTTIIKNAGRLRLKESDRLTATAQTLNTLGATVTELPEGLRIEGVPQLKGGTVDAWGDHRIAMMAAVASIACEGPVMITGGEAVNKSYPQFWVELAGLGKEIHLIEEV